MRQYEVSPGSPGRKSASRSAFLASSRAWRARDSGLFDYNEHRRLFGVAKDSVGNLPSLPGVFPDYPAPVVRNASDGAS